MNVTRACFLVGGRFTSDPEPWSSSISGSNFLVECFFLSWRYTPKCPSPRLSNIVDRKGQLYLPDPSHLTHNNGPLGIFRCLHNYSVVGTRRSGCLWLVVERCRKVALTAFCCSQFPHGFLSVLFSSGAVKSSYWLWDQSADLILTCQNSWTKVFLLIHKSMSQEQRFT